MRYRDKELSVSLAVFRAPLPDVTAIVPVPNRNSYIVLPNLGDLTIPVFIMHWYSLQCYCFKGFSDVEETGKLVYFDRSCSVCQLRQLSRF
jgi:hypothetical protein